MSYVKNKKEEQILVIVTAGFQIVPANENDFLAGSDLEILCCLGCSWKESLEKLKRS